MRWNNLFVCDQIFRPSKNEFEMLCDNSQMKVIVKDKLDALDDDNLFKEYLSNQTTFEQILQLCLYAISFEGRDTPLVIKSANLLKEILVNIWNRQDTDKQLSPSKTSVQLTRLSLGEYLLKMFEGSCRLHPSIPVFVLYESNYYTKLILKYLVYAFVPVSDEYSLFEQQSKMCVDLLMMIFEIVSISESSIISRFDYNQNIEQIVPRKDSLLVYDRNVIVDDELLHLITDFFVVSIANWSCQRIQYYAINTFFTELDHVVSYLFGSLLHVWFTMSIRAFPVSTQWKNLRNLLFMNLYRPSAVGEWSKLMIFITRLFVMKLTIDCEQDMISLIYGNNECEQVPLIDECGKVVLDGKTNSPNCYDSAGAAGTFRELFLSSPVSRTLSHSTTILQLWFRFLFLLDDPSYFMNHSHYFQDAFVITDRYGVLDLNNSMIETCAHINKNSMNNYFPILEKYLPSTFNQFMSTIEVVMNTLFFNQNVPMFEAGTSLESVISPIKANLNNSHSKVSTESANTRDRKPTIDPFVDTTADNRLNIQLPSQKAFPLIWVSPCGTNINKEELECPYFETFQQKEDISTNLIHMAEETGMLSNIKGRLSLDNNQIKPSLMPTNCEINYNLNDDKTEKTRKFRGYSAVFNIKLSNPVNTSTSSNEDQKLSFTEFVSEINQQHGSTDADRKSSIGNEKRSSVGDTGEFIGEQLRQGRRNTFKRSNVARPLSLYSFSASKIKLPSCNNTISVGDYDYSMSSGRCELGGFNIKQLVKDVNIRLCLAGQVKADSVVKIINPWLTNFLIPSFNSDESQIAFHRFLLEKACIFFTNHNNPIYTSSSGLISSSLESNNEQFHYSISLLYGSKEDYTLAKNHIFKRILLRSSIFSEDWIYMSKLFLMNNNYELGRATIIKLVCYLLCDFATSCKMSTQNLVNMYTLINICMCYQMNNSNTIVSKVVQYLNFFFQSDLKGSYMLVPMTYNAISVILTCKRFNQKFYPIDVSNTQTTVDESTINNTTNLDRKVEELNNDADIDVDLKCNALKTLLSLLNLPFHEYSLLFNVERFKIASDFNQLILLSKKYKNSSNVKYLYVNSSLVEILLHTLRVFVNECHLLDSNYSILLSCISSLFFNCVAVQQQIANNKPPATVVLLTETNYRKDIFSNPPFGCDSNESLNIMPKDCIESKDIFKMSVEVVTEILNEISTQKQFDLNVAISVVNFVSTFSSVNLTFLEKDACLRLVAKLCNFIHVQATKAPIYHNKQLHSTILATFLCISKWVLLQPWIMDEVNVRSGVLAVVELGIFGQVSENSIGESLQNEKIPPRIKVRQSISFRVGEMAETVIQLLSNSRHYNKNSISQYYHINEKTVLKQINSLRLNSHFSCDREAQFYHFLYQKSSFISFIEYPYSVKKVCDHGVSARLINPLGLIICRSACGKKVFEVEFDPVSNSKIPSYISSLKSFDDAPGDKVEKPDTTYMADEKPNNVLILPQPKEPYFHFQSNSKALESLIPFSFPAYEDMTSSYISTELFHSHKQNESHVYNQRENFSYLNKIRYKKPPQIHHKYDTLKMFLTQMNIMDSHCGRSCSAKPSSFVEQRDNPDHSDAQHALVASSLPGFDYKQVQLITTSNTTIGKELLISLINLDNISTRRTETVLVFYIKQQKVKNEIQKNDKQSAVRVLSENMSPNTHSSFLSAHKSVNIRRDKSYSGIDDSYDRSNCGELFNNFLNSIGTCVNSATHKKWAGNKLSGNTNMGSDINYDFIYREDWTCETAVFVDSWIPMGSSNKNPSICATLDGDESKCKPKTSSVDIPPKSSKSVDSGNIYASSSITTKNSISDIFAVVWLDNFDYFEFLRMDQMVSGLICKSGLNSKYNSLRYIIFLRHMKNGLICIHTFYKSEFLWKPFNNSSIPSGLVVHPNNLTTLLFDGISSIGILNELTKGYNIDPFSKRKHFIQQLVSSFQHHFPKNRPDVVDWLQFL